MKFSQETYKQYILRTLMNMADELENLEEKSVVNYVIGYLIGIGWMGA